MTTIDRRVFLLGTSVVLGSPLLGCGGGGEPLPPVKSLSAPTAISKKGVRFEALPLQHVMLVTSAQGVKTSIGGVGFKLGQLNYPADVAVLNELAYVVEKGNHRVQVFDADGQVVGALGVGVLNYPGGIIAAGEEILVSDSRNARIVGFDLKGNVTRTLGSGSLSAPRGLTYFDDGFLVADPGARKVIYLGPDGRQRGTFGVDWVLPYDVATDGTSVYVADVSANELAVLNLSGVLVDKIKLGSAPTYLSYRDGALYVA